MNISPDFLKERKIIKKIYPNFDSHSENIKVGDEVIVIYSGGHFSLHPNMFKRMGFENHKEHRDFPKHFLFKKKFKVIAIVDKSHRKHDYVGLKICLSGVNKYFLFQKNCLILYENKKIINFL